ncbi:SdpI family protein [Capnocytophaga sp.]|uniref:SdpI family protein n=1 Tax=Capnocytophaga sp. TaxID=44737 RepID=UPI0026DAC39C|nr:SdpI family protein [Capnocytophaga sp.]MDO5105272.1 SdpI family protein [Capnocytophaga sp.]
MSKEIIAILIFDFLITGIILLLHFFPAKEINYFYGYRTKRSMKNIENWQFAQKHFSNQWIFVPFMVMVTQALLIFVGEIDLKKEPPIVPIVSMVEFFLGSYFCALTTERELQKREDNTKKQDN